MVITTHYVEEARQADVVGIMRQGRLMVEDNPKELMLKHQADSLEEVFLLLCQQKNEIEKGMDDAGTKIKKVEQQQRRSLLSLPSFSNIRALVTKNWLTTKRNLIMLYFIFLAPAILCALCCLSVGQRPEKIPIAIVNHESNCSASFDPSSCQPNI